MKNGKLIISLVVLALLAGLGVWAYYHVSFSFANFRSQLAGADWRNIVLGLACIYLGYVFRSARWALLLRPNKRVGLFSLLGTQVIARVSESFGVDLTLLKLFDHPTVAEMSAEIESLILAKIERDSHTGPAAKHDARV